MLRTAPRTTKRRKVDISFQSVSDRIIKAARSFDESLAYKPALSDGPAAPTTFVCFVLRVLKREGYAVDAILAETGLTEQNLLDPDFKCGFRAKHRLLKNALTVTADPHLSVRLAAHFEPHFLGLPVYAAMNADTFRNAVSVLDRYLNLTFPSVAFAFPDKEAKTLPGEVAVTIRPLLNLGDATYLLCSSALVLMEQLFCAMLRTPRVASRAELVPIAPNGQRLKPGTFPFPIQTNCAQNRLYFQTRCSTCLCRGLIH